MHLQLLNDMKMTTGVDWEMITPITQQQQKVFWIAANSSAASINTSPYADYKGIGGL